MVRREKWKNKKTNKQKKKATDTIKQELLASILEVSDEEEDYLHMNEEVKNVKELKHGISLVKKY